MSSNSETTTFRQIAFVFLASYLCVFLAAQMFFDAQIWIAGRHLLAVYVVGSTLAVCQVYECWPQMRQKTRMAVIGACAIFLAMGVARTGRSAWISHHEGIGLTSKRWQNSELVARIRNLDSSVPVITNSKAAIYLLTGRIAYVLPTSIDGQSKRARPTYGAEMAQVEQKIEEEGAVLALFTRFNPEEAFVTDAELENRWKLRRLATTRDGYLLTKAQAND